MHSEMPLIVEYGLYIQCITGVVLMTTTVQLLRLETTRALVACDCMRVSIVERHIRRSHHSTTPTDRSKRNIRAYSGNASTAAMPDVFTTMDLLGPNDAKLIRLATRPQPSLGSQRGFILCSYLFNGLTLYS